MRCLGSKTIRYEKMNTEDKYEDSETEWRTFGQPLQSSKAENMIEELKHYGIPSKLRAYENPRKTDEDAYLIMIHLSDLSRAEWLMWVIST